MSGQNCFLDFILTVYFLRLGPCCQKFNSCWADLNTNGSSQKFAASRFLFDISMDRGARKI